MEHKLNFYKTDSAKIVADIIYLKISKRLKNGKNVLWLVSGGSTIEVAIGVAKLLSGQEVKNLYVSLADERFGEAGHDDSNWTQLIKEGFAIKGANLRPVLTGGTPQETGERFNDFIKRSFKSYDFKIALLGLGADGHTAGILPGSPAVHDSEMVSLYNGPDYSRITLTPLAIRAMDEVIVFAQGQAKQTAIENLMKKIDIDKQPAQVIKQVPTASVYSSLVGENI